MKLNDEMKRRIKEEKLLDFSQRIYVLELDIVALGAVGSEAEQIEKARKALDGLQKAYDAVEAYK